MGSDVLLNPLSSPLGHRFPLNNCNSIPTSNSTRCFSTSSGGGRWESNSRRQKEYQRFIFDDELRANFKEDDFGFGSAVKQRIWWSDDSSLWGDDYEDEEAGFGSFGVMEDSIGFAWVTKVLRAFGWMLPAVIMSAVLGTGTNTIIMALALPLAQSALSLVMDAIWGWSNDGPRSKSKKKKRPYARAASNPGIRTREGQNTRNGKGVGDYQSWAAATGASDGKNSRSTVNFGGWDELDNHGMEGQSKKPPNRRLAEPTQGTDGKLSKRIRRRETPLLLRLFIAVFPFMGSWTKLL